MRHDLHLIVCVVMETTLGRGGRGRPSWRFCSTDESLPGYVTRPSWHPPWHEVHPHNNHNIVMISCRNIYRNTQIDTISTMIWCYPLYNLSRYPTQIYHHLHRDTHHIYVMTSLSRFISWYPQSHVHHNVYHDTHHNILPSIYIAISLMIVHVGRML